MRKTLAALLTLAVPLTAFAFDYEDHSDRYEDADDFTMAESAGISLLTEVGAVEGNPDGTYRPSRQLNRAEFAKIALNATPSPIQPDISVEDLNCFPDVDEDDWFSSYVCALEYHGIVDGYPNGRFHPEKEVNYVEAVKILANLFDYEVVEGTGEFWYRPYMNEAEDRGVLIPGNLPPGHLLTRGQIARLAAAFRAEYEGELDLYRDAEQGDFPESSSSSRSSLSSSRSSVSSMSSTSSLSSRSSSSQSLAAGFPAESQFLILGERGDPIASASFFARLEPARVRIAKVVMEDEYESIESMYLVDGNGEQLGQMNLDPLDTTDQTWVRTFSSGTGKRFEKDSETVLGIEVLLKGRNNGGRSEELVQVDTFTLTVEGEWSQNTYENIPAQIPYPMHQTAQSEITSVTNSIGDTNSLPLGNDQLVAGFSFDGEAIPQAQLVIETLEFDVAKASAVGVSGFELGATDTGTRTPCSLSSNVVTCSSIPAELGTIGSSPRQLRLFADVTLASGASNPFLQISLNQPGAIGTNGAVRWTDGTGHYTWVNMEAPVARGTRWE